jgi:hypothetical protein
MLILRLYAFCGKWQTDKQKSFKINYLVGRVYNFVMSVGRVYDYVCSKIGNIGVCILGEILFLILKCEL